VNVAVPSTVAWKARPTMPLSGHSEWNLQETYDYQHSRDSLLPDVIARLNASQLGTVFLVDVGWFFVYTPFSLIADTVRHAYTGFPIADIGEWADTVDHSDVTIVYKSGTPVNKVVLDVYGDCAIFENAEYVTIDAPNCRGRSAQLKAAYEARNSEPV